MKSNVKKIAVIGHFGFGDNLLNGQTIKTKIITNNLEKDFGNNEVVKFDTHGGLLALLKLPFQVINAVANCKNIIIFPAQNGLKTITPMLHFLNLFYRRSLHYCVIGGWLPGFIQNRKKLKKHLKLFKGIYVETAGMADALDKQGFKNIAIMPNCKDLCVLREDELTIPFGEPLKLCTFSRVMREKGIEDAVEAVKKVNMESGRVVYTLDIYGQVDKKQTLWFEQLMKHSPVYIRYGGLVPFDKSVHVLKDYFALLFPTYYEGEGFAGTLLDSMAAGVPVIASDWKYNNEIVNGNNGILCEPHNVNDLANCLQKAISIFDRDFRKNVLIEYTKYKPNVAVMTIIDRLEE